MESSPSETPFIRSSPEINLQPAKPLGVQRKQEAEKDGRRFEAVCGGVLAKPVGTNVVFYTPDAWDARGRLFLESHTGRYPISILRIQKSVFHPKLALDLVR